MQRFHGKNALVTGGASGIGLACAQRLRAEGAQVWIADLRGRAQAICRGEPGLHALDIDVADAASVEAAVKTVLAAGAVIDVVINSAGIVLEAAAQDTSPADFARIVAVNLAGTFHVTRFVLPGMIERRSGAIVNVGSDAALVGQRAQAAYCASKGGVVQLTRATALDAAPYGIRVNCVCPCFVDTPLVQGWIAGSADPSKARREVETSQPMGRIGRPEEIAAAAAFLASDEARFVTGVALPVDGGSIIP